MAEATIPVRQDVKDKINSEKSEHESYNAVLLRLLGEHEEKNWTEEEIRGMARAEAKGIVMKYD